MGLEQRVRKLEREVAEMQKTMVTRRVRVKSNDDPAAEKWIINFLSGRKSPRTLDIDLAVIPRWAEVVHVIIDAGRKAGFTQLRLRQARLRMDGRVVVEHVRGSKQWMWRLLKS